MRHDKPRTEVWTYIGLREQKNGSFTYGWRDPEGDIYVFKKRFRRVAVGGQIEVTLTDDDKIIVTGPDAPRPLLSRYQHDDEIAGWVAADEYANNTKRLKAIERQAANAVPLEDILSTVQRLASSLSASQKRAFAAVVLEVIFADMR
jgi:hypothetical protein